MKEMKFPKNVLRSEWKGSFTIEAAVLLPLIMVIIVAILFISFYIHDSVILRAVSAAEIIEQTGKGSFEPSEIRSAVEQTLEERLIVLKSISVTVENSGDSLSVCCSGSFSYPMKWINRLFGNSFRLAETKVEISNMDGRGQLLKEKMISDGLSVIENSGEEGD